MRELRTCPVTGRTVLVNDAWLDAPPEPVPAGPCWYCGHSGPVIATWGPGGGPAPRNAPGDGARAVPHPEPALGIEGDPRPLVLGGAVRRQAVGAHELVFGAHAEGVLLRHVADRWRDLRGDRRLRGFGATRRHAPRQLVDAVEAAALRALERLGAALRGCPIDLVVVDGEPWRLELLPRLAAPAAVELATGMPVHGVLPEVAAAFLRGHG